MICQQYIYMFNLNEIPCLTIQVGGLGLGGGGGIVSSLDWAKQLLDRKEEAFMDIKIVEFSFFHLS